jgi:hypothetical protein
VRFLLLLTLLACTRPPVRPCPPVVDEVALAAEDAALRRWKTVIADGFRAPAGTPPAALVPELLGYLGSPDPVRRDRVSYEVLDHWIRRLVLGDAEVRALAERLIAAVRGPLQSNDGVFERSFAALVLASVVERDVAAPLLSDTERRAILAAARDYAHRETDLRGHTGVRGWAHAAAHTADLLAQLAKVPSFTDDERATMLDAVAGFVVRRHGAVLEYGEDDRLGVAVVAVVRSGVAQPALAAWVAALRAAATDRWGRVFDARRYAARRNARNLLFTLFVQLSVMTSLSDGERELLAAVRAVLAE